MKKINILFLTIGRLTSTQERNIYMDLINEFREKKHNLYVVSPIERREKKQTHYYLENDVHFLRVKTGNLKKNNLIEKGLNTILIESLYKNAIKKHYGKVKFDLVIYSTPPITFANVIKFIKKRDSAKTYLLLKDIFPQNAVDLKMIKKNSFIHNYFKKKEKQLYQISDYIGCMSQANMNYILKYNKYLNKDKVEVNPNSISPVHLQKIDEDKIFNHYNIPKEKVKFIYGGNLGKPQDIPFLLECIKSNRKNNNVHFIVVGSGTRDKVIIEYAESDINTNLTYIGQLAKKEYDKLISLADVGMIFLDSNFTIPNFPSRLLSYMEAEIPVLAATDNSTDIGDIILENNFGYKCISNNIENFNSILPNFYNSIERNEMGKNARRYLEENYTVTNSYSIIMKHFN